MKKFIVVSLLIIISLFFVQSSFAQEIASESAQTSYQLPYAGLLPDSPLYFIKGFRDRVIEFLISDPLKKAEFDLLSADKRLSMGIALFDKKEYDLSESTISKGENYLEDGINKMELAKTEGRQIGPSLLVNYDSSTKKHKEVISGLVSKSKGNTQVKFKKDLERVQKYIDRVTKLNL